MAIGDIAPLRKKGTAPTQFLAHVCCGQTAVWMKTPLGKEVDHGPGEIVKLMLWSALNLSCKTNTIQTPLFQYNLGKPAPERLDQSGF